MLRPAQRLPLLLLVFLIAGSLGITWWKITHRSQSSTPIAMDEEYFGELIDQPIATPSPSISPSPSPSPSPLSLAEMNQLYGPCTSLPVLMYHHIQTAESAEARGQTSLTVNTPIFQQHLQYLHDQGYTTITPADLANFFDEGTSLPAKPVLLTFDDGYDDFVTDAVPHLRAFDLTGTLYLSTGLTENPGYVSWNGLTQALAGSKIVVENHTWSHRSMKSSMEAITSEISTAQQQLVDHSFGNGRSFAYPYGITSPGAQEYLSSNSYTLAFTTQAGRIHCKGKRYLLPRIRIGNGSLKSYGL